MSTGVLAGERRRVYPGVDQAVLRVLVVLGAMVSLVAAQAAGGRPALWVQGLVLGLAVLGALRPEGAAGTGLLLVLAYVWTLAPETLSPLVLLTVAGMLLAHLAALVAAQGPARMPVDPVQARRWLLRGSLLWVLSAAVWGAVLVADELPGGRLAYATGLTVLTVLAVATARLLPPRRTPAR